MDSKELLAPAPDEEVAPRPNQPKSPGLRRTTGHTPTAPALTISVVVPAHNEEAYLKRTLTSLRRQKYPCEIIVVANGCNDGTAEAACGLCDRLIVLTQKGLGAARNSGARVARGDLLIFLDADTLLERNALRTIASRFTRRDAAGTLKGRPDSDRPTYRLIYCLKNFIHCSLLHNGSSGVIICWRNQFIGLGGFDERLEVRENSELIKRLKRFGQYQYIGQTAATTSMRRYERLGVGRVAWLWTKLWLESFFTDLHHRTYEIVR